MSNEISIYSTSRSEPAIESIDFDACEVTSEANPTSRCLSGSNDFWAKEEWAEPVQLPDGRKGTRLYLFDEDDITDDNGEPLEAEQYDWSAAHCVGIVLDS